MSDLDLEAIKERCDAATPGPWALSSWTEWGATSYGVKDVAPPGGTVRDSDPAHRHCLTPMEESDAAFIAHAREDVPALVAEVERLREALHAADMAMVLAVGRIRRGTSGAAVTGLVAASNRAESLLDGHALHPQEQNDA